jgi:Uncharacterized protein family UPF0029
LAGVFGKVQFGQVAAVGTAGLVFMERKNASENAFERRREAAISGSMQTHPALGQGMRVLDNIISDRGSKYAVSGGACASDAEARALVAELCRSKKFAKATHHSWGLIAADGPLKNDDGEAGAGMVITRMLERAGVRDHVVIVTRWYGGKHLGGDRFRHVQEAVRVYLEEM